MTVARQYRRYDPRLRNLVAVTGDIDRFRVYDIPRSTLREWIKNGPQEFFSLPELAMSSSELIDENLKLKLKLAAIHAEQILVLKTIKIFGFQIQYMRLPSAESKSEILAAINNAMQVISLRCCLDAIGLSAQRYFHWLKRQVHCQLNDQSSCPRLSPTQMTVHERRKIQDLYTSKEFAHYSIKSLSWLGKRTGEIIASASTWSRVIRELGLKRNRIRIYPEKPKIGIRASAPGQIWHLDLTILRLEDGTRAFVQAVIDNFSRYVLAWNVSLDYGGLHTKDLLLKAIAKAQSLGLHMIPEVFVDSGTENLNSYVDELVASERIRRIVAQIDIEFSNSMVEMLFQRLKHRHLFTIALTHFEILKKGVNFYFTESNTKIPHSALKGATPEEVITGKWNAESLSVIKVQVVAARNARVEYNLGGRCVPCLA